MSDNATAKSLQAKLVDLSASGFYSGHFPFASGTAGSGAAVIFLIILFYLFPGLAYPIPMTVFCAAFTIFSIWIADKALELEIYGSDSSDPKQVVIDEFAGLFVTMIGLAPTLTNFVLAFFMFRFFDILKPTPARDLEALHGGKGIVLDDVAAGIMANIVIQLLLIFLGW
jgi:phosphatidylglycerophosphatase A